jgi:DNA polymerase-3 subunit gamma/tau
MVIIRLIYAADLPDPADLVKKLKAGGMTNAVTNGAGTSQVQNTAPPTGATATSTSTTAPITAQIQNEQTGQGQATAITVQMQTAENLNGVPEIKTMADIVQALENSGEMVFATQVRMFAHPVKITDGALEFRPAEGAPERLSQDLSQKLKAATGNRWVVSISNQAGEPTLAQLADQDLANLRNHIMEQPLVKNIIDLFPGAKLKEITDK